MKFHIIPVMFDPETNLLLSFNGFKKNITRGWKAIFYHWRSSSEYISGVLSDTLTVIHYIYRVIHLQWYTIYIEPHSSILNPAMLAHIQLYINIGTLKIAYIITKESHKFLLFFGVCIKLYVHITFRKFNKLRDICNYIYSRQIFYIRGHWGACHIPSFKGATGNDCRLGFFSFLKFFGRFAGCFLVLINNRLESIWNNSRRSIVLKVWM